LLDYKDLTYRHKENCLFKDSSNTEKKNIHKSKIDDEMIEVEYDVYCSCCGEFLWNFSWGYENMY